MKHRKRKKLKKLAVHMHVTQASDYPHAPPLLALMLAGEISQSVPSRAYKDTVDGHD